MGEKERRGQSERKCGWVGVCMFGGGGGLYVKGVPWTVCV